MRTLITFGIAMIALGLFWKVNMSEEAIKAQESVQKEQTIDFSMELYNLSAVESSLKLADIGFYPELVNEPVNALDYEGNRKVAANLGVYLADLIYTKNTADIGAITKNFGAIMELSTNMGMSDEMMSILMERYEHDNASYQEIDGMLQAAMQSNNSGLSEAKQTQLYAYLVLGNFIEKLYLTSNIIMRPKQTELPKEAEANLKRGMLQYVAGQSAQLQDVLDLLSSVEVDSRDELVQKEIEKLIVCYKNIEMQQGEFMNLTLAEMFQSEDVVNVFNQIERVREKIVT